LALVTLSIWQTPPWADFLPKLILTIIDKGAFALIAIVFGYWISRRLEAYKADQQRVMALERDKANLSAELERARRTRDLEYREKQLSQFYWPICFRFMKDTAIWKLVPHLYSKASKRISDQVGREIELNYLIKNHEEIVAIMESNIHLAQADPELLQMIGDYVRHVAVYRALRATNTYDLNPIDVGEPLPKDLLAKFEDQKTRLQSEFDALVKPQ
jgi:hypothetical protein